MFRRYNYGRLKNNNPFKLGASPNSTIWSLPPRIVAEFAGELSQVMLNAAEEYVYERCLMSATRNFEREISRPSKDSDQVPELTNQTR